MHKNIIFTMTVNMVRPIFLAKIILIHLEKFQTLRIPFIYFSPSLSLFSIRLSYMFWMNCLNFDFEDVKMGNGKIAIKT